MTQPSELGVTQVADRIHGRLQRYLEAQYHIRDTALIEERRILLQEPGGISQRPFIEVTPSYSTGAEFSTLRIPKIVGKLLQDLSNWSPPVGVFPPYRHQSDALESFFAQNNDGDDLIVATGTGSGKTETFLYAILGLLGLEGAERTESFQQDGVRALLLYPMNALVSDQTSRLRNIFGDERLAEYFRANYGRHPRFGMYTSRTPYPGPRKAAKDQRHLAPVLAHYERLATSENTTDVELVRELQKRGRWPSKDILGFFAKDLEDEGIYRSGKKKGQAFTQHHWGERFLTQAEDRELFTRHEMQQHAPDILVTNYSMLEYMLLRPIERSIFSQTREWLNADQKNQLLLVLDEAHMYRGVGGAEVGLLIRRLVSRLGVNRDRLRCIMTSASLGVSEAADVAGQAFARGLTGSRSARAFAVIRGTHEQRTGKRSGNNREAAILGKIDPITLAVAEMDLAAAHAVIASLAEDLQWSVPPPIEEGSLALRQYVATRLTGFGPLELLIEQCSGNAMPFEELSRLLFPTCSQVEADRASDGLLAMGCFARRTELGRHQQPLLPTRVHMLFRGLPTIHACINSKCSFRRHATGEERLMGRLYTQPRTKCHCGSRVFELYTHRDCGAAYLRVFGSGPGADFFWHERGGTLKDFGKPLHELHLFLEEPHPQMRGSVQPITLDIITGRVVPNISADDPRSRLVYRPSVPAASEGDVTTFSSCPFCTRRVRTGKSPKIMDLATKGEQPFANLVREQFVCQAPTREPDEIHPNEGRKALLFSDGRQKAARLARDLPREVERDSFREAIVLAVSELKKHKPEAVLDDNLYAAFVSVCARYHLHFFDGPDQKRLLEECIHFEKYYGGDLGLALGSEWLPSATARYRLALLRQVADPYYSLAAACAAVVRPRRIRQQLFERQVGPVASPEVLSNIANAWTRRMLEKSAFDPELTKDVRQDEFEYFDPVGSEDGLKRFFIEVQIRSGLGQNAIASIRSSLFEIFTREGPGGADSGRLLLPNCFLLELAIDNTWLQCAACGYLQIELLLEACSNCGERRLENRPPDHPYMVARKGFFRESLRAVLSGVKPVHITAEEHTAQLSQRDAGVVYATTEEFELRFQDIPLDIGKPPIDVLSCTTTMEVGVDIGSLTAVGLRTVPPQRENYQQRAGRAGRRGTSVSSVVTFAQGGPHDAFYFANPKAMISGPPRDPRIKSDNRRLARRHIHSHLLQTFFHSQLDKLSPEEEQQLMAARPHLHSAFGTAKEFYDEAGDFTFGAFEAWIKEELLHPESVLLNEIVRWLPDDLAREEDKQTSKKTLVQGVAEQLLDALRLLSSKLREGRGSNDETRSDNGSIEDEGSLIEILFDKGLLPSYAFPTDLCAFVIQEWDKNQVRMKERPQLGKGQALSEYAPGRLLVVNKLTYRVGGVYVEGPATTSPAVSLFNHRLVQYVGCPLCPFIRLERGNTANPTSEGSPCPICDAQLYVRELLDPPAFSPEKGREVQEGDRDQDVTYASTAQLPELVGQEEFNWDSSSGKYLQHAYGEDVLLVIANKGNEFQGFSICEVCGAAWPSDGAVPTGSHPRPFLVSRAVLNNENATHTCNGTIRSQIFLGHEFRTDILLLRMSFSQPMDFSPKQPWLHDALNTLAEALALGASLHLDIDPGELSSGYRLVPARGNEAGAAEIFLFDTASGGAGYAAEAGAQLHDVLDRAEELLEICPNQSCERSCTDCLRHYGNRFLHPRLDRHLALDLLCYARRGEIPNFESLAQQAITLGPLARFLELEGCAVSTQAQLDGIHVPLVVTPPSGVAIAIGSYPTLVSRDYAWQSHPLKSHSVDPVMMLPAYLIGHDLPAAYQYVIRSISQLSERE